MVAKVKPDAAAEGEPLGPVASRVHAAAFRTETGATVDEVKIKPSEDAPDEGAAAHQPQLSVGVKALLGRIGDLPQAVGPAVAIPPMPEPQPESKLLAHIQENTEAIHARAAAQTADPPNLSLPRGYVPHFDKKTGKIDGFVQDYKGRGRRKVWPLDTPIEDLPRIPLA
jgi:hypothetical protein